MSGDKKQFSKEEIEAGVTLTYSEFFMNVIALESHDPQQKELNYHKKAVQTPDGGTYLISILHVDGPKLNLQDLASKAEAQEKDKG